MNQPMKQDSAIKFSVVINSTFKNPNAVISVQPLTSKPPASSTQSIAYLFTVVNVNRHHFFQSLQNFNAQFFFLFFQEPLCMLDQSTISNRNQIIMNDHCKSD